MNWTVIDQKILKRFYKKREGWSHKGDFGKVLVIGGSKTYTGSPALVALSALRGGADVVKILAPERAADVCAGFSPELITIRYDKEYLDSDAISQIRSLSEWADVITIGNGVETGTGQRALVNTAIKEIRKRIVIDADALKVLDKRNLSHNMLLTPNSHEFKLLFEEDLPIDVDRRAQIVKEKAKEFNTNILVKGHIDIVSDGGEVFLNKINSVYMTKGGTGDTLCGISAALLAQGDSIGLSAACASFINGYTGKSIAKTKKEALSPVDIINGIASTITRWRIQ